MHQDFMRKKSNIIETDIKVHGNIKFYAHLSQHEILSSTYSAENMVE